MPGPAVYVAVVVGTAAAGFAFKHFVYDPHIAPKIDVWKHEFRARRQARRRRRQGPVPVAVALNSARKESKDRVSDISGSDDSDDAHVDRRLYELENMVTQEVLDWRSEVDRAATLRKRKPRNVDDHSVVSGSTTSWSLPQNAQITLDNAIPSQIVVDFGSESTSTIPSRQSSHTRSPQVSTLRSSTSRSTLRSPQSRDVQLAETRISPPTPTCSNFSCTESDGHSHTIASASPPVSSPSHVPSLSLSHPVDLDREHDIELLSAPSSRPDSPFSALSQPSSIGGFSAGSHEGRTSPAHLTNSPPLPPLPGIAQLLPPPDPSQSSSPSLQSLSEINSFYQAPTTTIMGTIPVSRSESELEFLSFDGNGNSTRNSSSDNISSMSSHDRMSVQSFNATDDDGFDVRDLASDFGGSEASMDFSWASLSDAGSSPSASQGNRGPR
ncbi:hypothetical protein E1B28_004917 [Marasmius oreades]|uniref:Uncharacterized protein n=1 Tax=Marasmius oreades TaxID=181124 RepID=A0A9P7UZS9_9AGAR|nr:uncharacterized protein E1B28_004917 [Marasmius oreades]KAG7097580.1 hypothetical protein E1B28_004917 [Marasmius oreades]